MEFVSKIDASADEQEEIEEELEGDEVSDEQEDAEDWDWEDWELERQAARLVDTSLQKAVMELTEEQLLLRFSVPRDKEKKDEEIASAHPVSYDGTWSIFPDSDEGCDDEGDDLEHLDINNLLYLFGLLFPFSLSSR